jgi:hypothetical protein
VPQAAPLPADWAEEEFGAARLGDRRLTQRLLVLARDFFARPQAPLPQACQSWARTKAAYRFCDHQETDMQTVLQPHYQATWQRLQPQRLVLAVQDTTTLNYTAHPATEELGPISSQAEGAQGLLLHSTLAFTLEGTPLGLLDTQCWARDGANFGKKHQRKKRSVQDKESHKWLASFRAVAQAQPHCPHTTLVSVGDREADVYELFQLAQADSPGPRLLIRAQQDRLLEEGQQHLWDSVRHQPPAGTQLLEVPRRANRPARQARLEVRFAPVTLHPPQRPGLEPVALWAVLAEETGVPAGVEPLCWLLLTTCPVENFPQACQKLRWYSVRWKIEIYHRTLKSGCRIEQRQLGSADRLETCLAIDLVVAWRVFHLAMQGRETPDLPCTVFFEDAQWKALTAYFHHDPVPPATPPNLRQAMRLVARLGGFLARKGDGEPGTQTLWLGLQRLDDLTAMYLLMTRSPPPPVANPTYATGAGF